MDGGRVVAGRDMFNMLDVGFLDSYPLRDGTWTSHVNSRCAKWEHSEFNGCNNERWLPRGDANVCPYADMWTIEIL